MDEKAFQTDLSLAERGSFHARLAGKLYSISSLLE
jgi:hypothetical protein